MATPDYDGYLFEAWGTGSEIGFGSEAALYFSVAANLIVGTNPPYFAQDFLAFYPNFGQTTLFGSATSSIGSAVLTGLASTVGLNVGMLITGAGVPDGAVVASTTGTTVTMSLPATVAASFTLSAYTTLLAPLVVINAYIYLATNSLFQARWGEMWTFAMVLYVAHFLTLYLIAQSVPPGSTAGQVAAAGLAVVIKTAKAVQDVSTSGQVLGGGLEDYGAFQLTIYGQQLATFAKTVGSGAMLIW